MTIPPRKSIGMAGSSGKAGICKDGMLKPSGGIGSANEGKGGIGGSFRPISIDGKSNVGIAGKDGNAGRVSDGIANPRGGIGNSGMI